MKFKEIKAMGEAQLKEKLSELKLALLKDNAQIATKTNPKNPGKIKVAKKDIARILSVLPKEVNKKL